MLAAADGHGMQSSLPGLGGMVLSRIAGCPTTACLSLLSMQALLSAVHDVEPSAPHAEHIGRASGSDGKGDV